MMNFTISPNIMTLGLGAVGALVVFYSSAIIWSELKRANQKELMLRAGIIVSVSCVFNDSALGLELAGSLIPLYYLGNAFEAVRLNFHYQSLAYEKINKLEGEIDKLAQVAQFGYAAANISHDIKNHLMIISHSLKKVSRQYTDDNLEKSTKYIKQINDVTKLYTNLFKYNNELECSPQNLSLIITDAMELLKDRLNKAKIKTEVSINESIEVKCNHTALTLCLVNLIGNAIDEISAQESPWLEVIYHEENKTLKIVDSGNGIAPEVAQHIFEVNYSTKKNKGGSGLGLAISQHIIEKSGLSMKLDQEAKNTTFIIDFT